MIELFIDTHDRHAGFCFAVLDRALNRRGAAIFRQQRRVHVHESMLRNCQQRRGQNLSVRDHDADIRVQSRKRVDRFTNLRRLHQRQDELFRAHRKRGRVHLHAASRRLVGLRDDVHDFVLARDGVERRNRELRSAEEDDPQSGAMLSRGRRGSLVLQFFCVRNIWTFDTFIRLRRRPGQSVSGRRLRRLHRRIRHRRRLILIIARHLLTAAGKRNQQEQTKSSHRYG